jgi:putative sigma-54 modulation protein
MEIQITARHTKVSDSAKDLITSKLAGLEKFYDKLTSCHVIVDEEPLQNVVEIVMNGQKHTVKALAKEANLGKAIDEAVSKAERQLVKINEKIKGHRNGKPGAVPQEAVAEAA